MSYGGFTDMAIPIIEKFGSPEQRASYLLPLRTVDGMLASASPKPRREATSAPSPPSRGR